MGKINYDPYCTWQGVGIQFHIHKHGKGDAYLDSSDKRYDHYSDYYNGVLDTLKSDSDSNVYTGCRYDWTQGDDADANDLKSMISMSQKLSPEELEDATNSGLISVEEAHALTMVGALEAGGLSEGEINDAMQNFYALSYTNEIAVLDVMSDRDVAHEVSEGKEYGTDDYVYTDTPDELNGIQMRTALFLSEAESSQLGNLRQFAELDYSADDLGESEYSDLTKLEGSVTEWGTLSDTQRSELASFIKALPAKDQEEAAIEGYGSTYDLSADSDALKDAKQQVLDMKDSVDAAISELNSQIDSGDHVEIISKEGMADYLAGVTGFDDMADDVQSAFVDYALSEVSQHVVSQLQSRDDVVSYCESHITGWEDISPEDQENIIDNYMNSLDVDTSVDDNGNYTKLCYDDDGNVLLNADGTPMTEVVGQVLTPDDLRGAGLDPNGIMDVGTLMFLVLMDREDSQEELIRGYASDVDDKNEDVKNATSALSVLRAQDPGDGTVDINDLTFTSESGQEISISDFCQIYGVDMPEDSDGDAKTDLDETGLQSLIDSIKSSSDTMTTDAESALQKLQQAIDRLTNTNTMITNFESTWTSMEKTVIGNTNIR